MPFTPSYNALLLLSDILGRKNFILLSFILYIHHSNAHAQTDSLYKALSAFGLENIKIIHTDHKIIISVENNIYRWTVKGISKTMEIITQHVSGDIELTLIILHNGIPQVNLIVPIKNLVNKETQTSSAEIAANLKVTSDISSNWYQLKKIKPFNSHTHKFDIVIYPYIRALFGNFDDPVKTQINISPALHVSLWKGMTATAQVILPLHNDFEEEPIGNNIRPGLLTMNQTARLPSNAYVSFTAGYFTRNRYGIDLDTRKYFLNGKISLGARVGYTGIAPIYFKNFTSLNINIWTWFTTVAYRYAKYNLTLKAGYGRFIDQDEGFRLDTYRQFGEITIGFFALRSADNLNGGFNFSIPIPPRKYFKKNIVRIRPVNYFVWEYRAKGLPSLGRFYNTGHNPDEYRNYFNPDYISHYISSTYTR